MSYSHSTKSMNNNNNKFIANSNPIMFLLEN